MNSPRQRVVHQAVTGELMPWLSGTSGASHADLRSAQCGHQSIVGRDNPSLTSDGEPPNRRSPGRQGQLSIIGANRPGDGNERSYHYQVDIPLASRAVMRHTAQPPLTHCIRMVNFSLTVERRSNPLTTAPPVQTRATNSSRHHRRFDTAADAERDTSSSK